MVFMATNIMWHVNYIEIIWWRSDRTRNYSRWVCPQNDSQNKRQSAMDNKQIKEAATKTEEAALETKESKINSAEHPNTKA